MNPSQNTRLSEFKSYVKEEFVHHMPYTLLGMIAGVLFVWVSMGFGELKFGEEEFHMAHYIHLFFSGAASAAIFKSYRDSYIKAIPVAMISSLMFCSLSDTLIPVVGLSSFGYEAHIHLCVLEHPWLVLGSIIFGVFVGLVGIQFFNHCNRAFHLFHILISTAASTLYMVSFIPTVDAYALFVICFTLFFALAIPCLVGDMILPLCFVDMRGEYLHHKVHHTKD